MRKVRIDFAPPGLRRTLHRVPPNAWALVPAALVLVFIVVSGGLKYRDQLDAIARLRAQAQVRTATAQGQQRQAAPARAVPEAQANAVNTAVQQLNLPWRGLHDAIQAATPASVALLALEPDAKKNSVRITAEAKSSDDMLGYVARLQDVDWFGTVALVRHEINDQDPNRPIRFQVDAQWKAAP
jgi:Tfp pilus assembly protein PilN